MPTLQTTAAPTTELYYDDRGQGTPVVLIHGWPLSHRMWESQANALVDAGFRVVAYDRRGFGLSGKPDGGYDYDTFASDLNDLMTRLDLNGAVLAGFSMGGGEVARYVGRYGTSRVAKAMLVAAVPPFLLKTKDNPDGIPAKEFDGMIAGVKADRIAFLEGFFPAFFNWKPGSGKPADDVVAHAKSIAWAASPRATQDCITAFGTTDFRDDLKKLTVPTLVIHGDDDRIVPIDVSGKRAAKMIEGAKLEVIKGAPHGLNATHGEKLTKLMVEFVKG